METGLQHEERYMEDINTIVFIELFKQACEKCFGHSITTPLSEPDSKILSNKILEQTGLVIGVKSVRNYSIYIFNAKEGRKENPSVATLDTLARFILNAPYTDEAKRKNTEGHHPYWFKYRSTFLKNQNQSKVNAITIKRKTIALFIAIILVIGVGFYVFMPLVKSQNEIIKDNFDDVSDAMLRRKGWTVKSLDSNWWNKRQVKAGHLSLYTMRGDNWGAVNDSSGIKNLLVMKMSGNCFTTEIHFSDFIPSKNWQQAGILLSENSTFTGKVIRLSISYNDFFGGYKKNPEIIIQGLRSSESASGSKPEEFAHVSIFSIDPGNEQLVNNNLTRAALRIEKKENHFRFLYSTGLMESFAFKEAASDNFAIEPSYIGLFAIQGLTSTENCIPANFDSFHFESISCSR